jgi:D-arabinose 1-dehydrogenase-like Zn-dependent alcohol dehydrogenase
MRAVQYRGVHDVAWTDLARPEVSPGTALIRVSAVGVCHTDVSIRAASSQMMASGTVLGHEIAGTIIEMAADAVNMSV